MLQHPQYTRDRIRDTAGRLRGLIRPHSRAVERIEVSERTGRISWDEAQKLDYRPAALGEQFGPLWSTYWFRIAGTVPDEWAGKRIDLVWETHTESTLWVDGRAAQGLNSTTGIQGDGGDIDGDSIRTDAVLLPLAAGGERLEFDIEMACNSAFGAMGHSYRTVSPVVLDRCDLTVFDDEAWRLYFDLQVLRELLGDAGNGLDPAFTGELLAELNRFCNIWRADDRATWPAAAQVLAPLLQRHNGTVAHELSAIGHAHIDTAWLWPVAETYRKCVRTFSSQLAYMDRYPDYRFACSQAQQYAWIKERNPELFDRIRAKAAAGQWIPVGGTWVEPDCNLPSGESLARQFLYGQRFFEREFGSRSTIFWNPDVFGYNGQLPQIMRQAGIERFLTQKLSWNRFTKPLHHTFDWHGIDGTAVLTHFPPADTYNATVSVEQLRRNAREYKDNDRSRHSFLLFGYGDGGGGPTPAMLERLGRVHDLQGVPRTEQRTPDEFFDLLEQGNQDRASVVGELYFEYHRGTYTSQAAVKLGNRRSEVALHDLEFLAALAARTGAADYPREALDELWPRVLINQFHDILPGSSIGEVYADAAADHAAVLQQAGQLTDTALRALGPAGDVPRPVNTAGVARAEVTETPAGGLVYVEAPAYGVGEVVDAGDAVTVTEDGDFVVLENAAVRAVLGRDGTLVRLTHGPSGREALAAPGNLLRLHEDLPTGWDAWDVDPFHLENWSDCPPAETCTVSPDPLRGEVTFERAIGKASRLVQTIRLEAGARRLEFRTSVDWHESHQLLRVAFPTAVHSMYATYEMQFGVAQRPTHYSTLADMARFEVPGHRFADLSEHGFGVSVLTDCKYGYSAAGNELRITLLRSPKWPDPNADMGRHEFAYAVLPHDGGWQDGGVVAEGLRFTMPLRWTTAAKQPGSYFGVDDPNVVLDTVKLAEDSDALVLRLYEAHGGRGTARLRVQVPFERAVLANLLEDDGAPLAVEGDHVVIPYRPFEIITVKLG